MPRRHLLPDIADRFPRYGQNLVRLAETIADAEGGPYWSMIDVGANIGDSTVQVRERVSVEAWCIEGDPVWLPFLRRNLRAYDRTWILPALLVTDDGVERSAVRSGGTTIFLEGGGEGAAAAQYSVEDLPGLSPLSQAVRLIKSDTDGFDTRLVPELARCFGPSRPVLFFEYDPPLSRRAGDPHPEGVWDVLEGLGYADVAIWDNFGGLLSQTDLAEARVLAREFDIDVTQRAWNYWDVALAHRDDPAGIAALSAACDLGR
jgi:FkbM family methyltransferase